MMYSPFIHHAQEHISISEPSVFFSLYLRFQLLFDLIWFQNNTRQINTPSVKTIFSSSKPILYRILVWMWIEWRDFRPNQENQVFIYWKLCICFPVFFSPKISKSHRKILNFSSLTVMIFHIGYNQVYNWALAPKNGKSF